MNTDTTIQIGKQARALAAALAIGATILSLSAGQAAATENNHPTDNGVRCVIERADGTLDFYLPGQQVWDVFTRRSKTCGDDGEWHREGAVEDPVAPKPNGRGVYAP